MLIQYKKGLIKKNNKKLVILIAIVGCLVTSFSFIVYHPCASKYKVSGLVVRVGAYCSGARPSKEVLNNIKQPKPYSNKKLFVKKGKENNFKKKAILEVTTDSFGKFSFSLPAGEYCIVDDYKYDKKNYKALLEEYKVETRHFSVISETCLDEWFRTPELVFSVVGKDLDSLTITYHDKCSWNKIPCVTYRGPLPP